MYLKNVTPIHLKTIREDKFSCRVFKYFYETSVLNTYLEKLFFCEVE